MCGSLKSFIGVPKERGSAMNATAANANSRKRSAPCRWAFEPRPACAINGVSGRRRLDTSKNPVVTGGCGLVRLR